MADVEIGIGKSARRAYGLHELAIVPSRRTRDANDVDISWQFEAFRFALPFIAAPRDGIVGPNSAVAIDSAGGLSCLDLEGLWTRYEDPVPVLDAVVSAPPGELTRRAQEAYAAPVRVELVSERVKAIAAEGAVVCGAVTPQRAEELVPAAIDGGLEVLVIAGITVSADHVSRSNVTLDLETFIRALDLPVIVGGCSSYAAALHLMRTGAMGVLVGVGPGESADASRRVLGVGAPIATAIADAAGARSRHLEETGFYVQVIADAPITEAGDLAAAYACGADAVMLASPLASAVEAPGRGRYLAAAAGHPSLPRTGVVEVPVLGSLSEILSGPSHDASGHTNLFGALRAALALSGYETIREFHKASVVVSGRGEGIAAT
ncbi:MAG: GuaB3 family IMP dehydrogenase-related protein [Acidimicrobiales bacterium]